MQHRQFVLNNGVCGQRMRMSGQSDMPAIVGINGRLLVKFTKPATREHPFMYHCHVLEHEDAGMMGQYTCT